MQSSRYLSSEIRDNRAEGCTPFFRIALLLALFWLSGCAQRPVQPPPGADRVAEKELFEQAEAHFKKGDLNSAMAAYSACLAQYPQGRQADRAMRRLGDIYFQQHQYGAAQAFYQKMIKQFPYSPYVDEVRLALVDLLIETRHETEALQLGRQMAEGKLTEDVRRQLWRRLEQLHRGTAEYGKASRYAYSIYASVPAAEKKYWFDRLMDNLRHLRAADLEALWNTIHDELFRGFLIYRQAVLKIEDGATGEALELLTAFQTRFPFHPLFAEVTQLAQTTAQGLQFEPYTIGCLLPLSGPYQGYGRRALNGIELAISRLQDSDPPPRIKLIVKDSAAAPERAVLAVQELAQARVGAIIGPMSDAEAAAREAQKLHIPMVTLTQKQDITTFGDYIFRHFITPQDQVARLVDYFCGPLGVSAFAVLYPRENYGQTFKDLFWDAVVKKGGRMSVMQAYDPGQTDFTDSVKNLVKAGQAAARLNHRGEPIESRSETENFSFAPEWVRNDAPTGAETDSDVGFQVLFIPDAPQKAALILPQLAYQDIRNVILAGTNLWHSEQLPAISTQFDGQIAVVDGFFKESRMPAARRFVVDYRAVYDQDPGLIEALAFDTANFLFAVMADPDIHQRNTLRDAMRRYALTEGVSGPLTFDEHGEAIKKLFLLRIQDGRFIEADGL